MSDSFPAHQIPEKLDWRPPGTSVADHLSIAILAPDIGHVFYEPGEKTPAELETLLHDEEAELKQVTGADQVIVRPIDPREGASGFGLGTLLQFLSIGADIIAWIGAVSTLAAAINRGRMHLIQKQEAAGARDARVLLSAPALEVLVAADLITMEGVESKAIVSVSHHPIPGRHSERRRELEEIYAAHAVIIMTADGDDDVAWAYLVYADGAVISKTRFLVPSASIRPWEMLHHKLPLLSSLNATS